MIDWPTARAQAQYESQRRGDHGVSIIVPFAPDSRERALNWAWLRRRYEIFYPDWQLLEGCWHGPWQKGAAISQAIPQATGSILIIADADCVLPIPALYEAVRRMEGGAPWVIPHQLVYRLGSLPTMGWVKGDPAVHDIPPLNDMERLPYRGSRGGGVMVMPRWAWDATGGIPPHFRGWGAEDVTMALILDRLVGSGVQLHYPLVHLWHPPQEHSEDDAGVRQNRAIYRSYCKAALQGQDVLWVLRQNDTRIASHATD